MVPQVRLVKSHPMIRFEGKVHNQIGDNLTRYRNQTGHELGRAAIEIIHVGYALSRDKINKKYNERLHLLEHEVEHAPNAARKAYYQYQLGNALFMLKKYERSARVLCDIDYTKLSGMNAYYTRFMHGYSSLKIEAPKEALESANQLIQSKEHEPIGYVLAGLAFNQVGRYKEALLMLVGAYERSQDEPNIRFALDAAYVMRLIATLCAKTGDLERADLFISEYLEKYPESKRGQEIQNAIRQKLESREIPAT